MFHDFMTEEDGAVTVDWVVLTAALVGLGLAVMGVISGGLEDLSGDTNDIMTGHVIETSFGTNSGTNSREPSAIFANGFLYYSGDPGSALDSYVIGPPGTTLQEAYSSAQQAYSNPGQGIPTESFVDDLGMIEALADRDNVSLDAGGGITYEAAYAEQSGG